MEWYQTTGKEQDIVMASCVRITRNLEGRPFPWRQTAADARAVMELVGSALEPHGFLKLDFADISRAAAYALAEEQYISHAFIRESLPHALFLNRPCGLSAAVGGEAHMVLQCMLPGSAAADAYGAVSDMERRLDEALPFAFCERWGYLTVAPADSGTATEVSALLFLPLLTEDGGLSSLTAALSRQGLELRRAYGDSGDIPLYRLTVPAAAARTEQESLARMEQVLARILRAERQAREGITGARREAVTDRVLRAEGVLRYAHALSVEEFLRIWTDVRLGVILGIIGDMPLESLTEPLITALPAHLATAAPTALSDDGARDRFRAKMLKERFNAQ